jgi:hypothetical protein
MPNQRSKTKVLLGGYLDSRLNGELVRLARREGMDDNKFGFIQKLIREALGDIRNHKANIRALNGWERKPGRLSHSRKSFSRGHYA